MKTEEGETCDILGGGHYAAEWPSFRRQTNKQMDSIITYSLHFVAWA